MYNKQALATADILLRKSFLQNRISYWQSRMQELSDQLDTDLTVSDFVAICNQKNNAMVKVRSLTLKLNHQ
mgnify:CR=1 FL=1